MFFWFDFQTTDVINIVYPNGPAVQWRAPTHTHTTAGEDISARFRGATVAVVCVCFFLLSLCFVFFFFTSGVALAREEEVENDRRHSCPRSAREWRARAYRGRNELYVGIPTGWIFVYYVRIESWVVLRYSTYTYITDVTIKYGTFHIRPMTFKQHWSILSNII